jgi:hypothetical protein
MKSVQCDIPDLTPRDEQPSRGYLRIPWSSKAEKYNSLREILVYTAQRTGRSEYQIAVIMTFFLEHLALIVACGRCVRIPGFGVFGPWTANYEDRDPTVSPRFVPARPWRQHVKSICPPTEGKNHELHTYRRSHHPSSRKSRKQSSTGDVMKRLRESFVSQMGGLVEPLPPERQPLDGFLTGGVHRTALLEGVRR